jgi:hypothetical protein
LAQSLGHEYVEPEHLLLGIFSQQKCTAARLLRALHIDMSELRHELDAYVSTLPTHASSLPAREPVLSVRTLDLFDHAYRQTPVKGPGEIRTAHLLMATNWDPGDFIIHLINRFSLKESRLVEAWQEIEGHVPHRGGGPTQLEGFIQAALLSGAAIGLDVPTADLASVKPRGKKGEKLFPSSYVGRWSVGMRNFMALTNETCLSLAIPFINTEHLLFALIYFREPLVQEVCKRIELAALPLLDELKPQIERGASAPATRYAPRLALLFEDTHARLASEKRRIEPSDVFATMVADRAKYLPDGLHFFLPAAEVVTRVADEVLVDRQGKDALWTLDEVRKRANELTSQIVPPSYVPRAASSGSYYEFDEAVLGQEAEAPSARFQSDRMIEAIIESYLSEEALSIWTTALAESHRRGLLYLDPEAILLGIVESARSEAEERRSATPALTSGLEGLVTFLEERLVDRERADDGGSRLSVETVAWAHLGLLEAARRGSRSVDVGDLLRSLMDADLPISVILRDEFSAQIRTLIGGKQPE